MDTNYNNHVLIGTWEGGAEDGSGLRTMVYNFGMTFHPDGSGVSFFWNKTANGADEDNTPIKWEHIEKNRFELNSIRILNHLSTKRLNTKSPFLSALTALNTLNWSAKEKKRFWILAPPCTRSRNQRIHLPAQMPQHQTSSPG